MSVEVVPEQLRRAGESLETIVRRVQSTDAGVQVQALAPAMPGGLAAGSVPVLADRWDHRIGVLAASIDNHAIVLATAARRYAQQDSATAQALGGGGW